MFWALRDDASIDTAISITRLPSPNAATSHVFSRMSTSEPDGSDSGVHGEALKAHTRGEL